MFMNAAPNTAAPPDLPDPQPDRPAAATPAPSRSFCLLNLVRKLIAFGKDLANTLQSHPSPIPLTLMIGFGTRDIALILARIMRGLRIAAGLEDHLMRNAVRLDKEPAPARAAASPRKPRAARPPTQPAAWRTDDAAALLAHLPTPEEIAAQLRHRPIGAVLADICSDLGITTTHPLWRELTDAVVANGGSFLRLMRDLFKRVSLASLFPPDMPLVLRMPPGWQAPPRSFATIAGTGPP